MQSTEFWIEDAPVIPQWIRSKSMCHVLTGERFGEANPALPDFNQPTAVMHRIDLDGTITDGLTLMGFEVACQKCRRDDVCRLVVIRLNVWRSPWNITDYLDALALLTEKKSTFCFIECAIGSVIALAYCCGMAVAHPTAEFGMLGSFTNDGDYPEEQMLDDGTVRSLQRLRPEVPDHVWRHLLTGTIRGEGAEHYGLVDCLRPSAEALIARLGKGAKE